MNATVVDIKEMIEAFALEEDSSPGCNIDLYPIFIGKEPAEPFNCITLFEIGTLPPQLTLDRNEIYEYPMVQIRVRANNYLEGWEMIYNIKNLLHGQGQVTWNGAFYTLIRCISGPALLDYDKNQRVRFIINFYIQRR
jgi:hypothetical protein